MGRCVHETDEKWGGESKGADEKWGGESNPCAGQRFIAALSHTGGQARKN